MGCVGAREAGERLASSTPSARACFLLLNRADLSAIAWPDAIEGIQRLKRKFDV